MLDGFYFHGIAYSTIICVHNIMMSQDLEELFTGEDRPPP